MDHRHAPSEKERRFQIAWRSSLRHHERRADARLILANRKPIVFTSGFRAALSRNGNPGANLAWSFAAPTFECMRKAADFVIAQQPRDLGN